MQSSFEGIQIPIEAIDNASAVMDKVTKSTQNLAGANKTGAVQMKATTTSSGELTRGLGQLGSSILGVNVATLGWIGVGVGVINIEKQMIAAVAENETVNVRLQATLLSTGRNAEISAKQIDAMATALEHASSFDDEKIISASDALLKFDNIDSSNINEAVKAMMNLTAATGGDLLSNTEALGRMIESGLIPRSWGFSAALKEQIKNEIAAGDTTKALGTALTELNNRFGGQYAAQLTTYDGKVLKLKADWGDFLEIAGKQQIGADKGFLDWLDSGILKLERLQEIYNSMGASTSLGEKMLVNSNPYLGILSGLDRWQKANDTLDLQSQQVMEDVKDQWGNVGLAIERAKTGAESYGLIVKSALGNLKTIISGDVGQASEDYAKKMADLQEQLSKAKKPAEKADITKQIDEETQAYQKRAAAIQYNIESEIVMASTSLTNPQKLSALSDLSAALGLQDEKTQLVIGSTQRYLGLLEQGLITPAEFAVNIKKAGEDITAGYTANASAADDAAQAQGRFTNSILGNVAPLTQVGGITGSAAESTKQLASSASKAESSINGIINAQSSLASSSAKVAPAISALIGQLKDIYDQASKAGGAVLGLKASLKGLEGTYVVTIVINTIGSVPSAASITGGGSKGTPSSGRVRQALAGGGPLPRGKWALVGDMPGGQLTPYSELVSPEGVVIPADMTRELLKSGAISPTSAYRGIVGKREGSNAANYSGLLAKRMSSEAKGRGGNDVPISLRGQGGGEISIPQLQDIVAAAVVPLEQVTTSLAGTTNDVFQKNAQTGAAQLASSKQNSNEQVGVLKDILSRLEQQPTTQDMITIMRTAQQLTV